MLNLLEFEVVEGGYMNKKHIFPTLIAIMLFSLYLHLNPWNGVFTSWGIRLSGNDPWYYLRLSENCVANFPYRIWFDHFTYFPYGTFVHFGSFVVYLTVILSIILNQPVITVSAFVPVIAGVLLPLPTYLFARSVSNEKVGILSAALIAVMPGQLLQRGLLGFNDHHIWEVFWLVVTLALYTYAIDKPFKKYVLFSGLAGISFWLYIVTWAPAFWFALFIVFCMFIISLLDQYHGTVNTIRYSISALIMLFTAFLLYIPLSFTYSKFSAVRYSPLQLIMMLLSMLIISYNIYLNIKIKKNVLKYVVTFILPCLAVIVSLLIYNPTLITTAIPMLYKKGGGLTIAEAQPIFYMTGDFSLYVPWLNFGTTFFFAILAYMILLNRVFSNNDKSVLPLLLGVIMFIAISAQGRWAYYYGLVCALYTAIVLDIVFTKFDLYKFLETRKLKRLSATKVLFSILILIVAFYPTGAIALEQSHSSGPINHQWYETLTWMRSNTPNGQYDELYNTTDDNFNNTYGIMSWWDYGHWITAIAHRIPNANPFQQGIGDKNTPGASSLFLSTDEKRAVNITKQLGVKFIITDIEMVTGKFHAIATWYHGKPDLSKYFSGNGIVFTTPDGKLSITTDRYQIPYNAKIIGQVPVPREKYYNTLLIKMHLLDAYSLKHYRLVYESDPVSINNYMGFQEIIYKLIYNRYFNENIRTDKTTGYVKVFEFVKGAKIIGYCNTTKVTIKTKIMTNKGRIFEYRQSTVPINGTYEFIVPYAQNTTYPVKAIEPYTVLCGNMTKSISVSDEDVEVELVKEVI
ncbi:oligosaccharyl transferase, archaeosortase A system-associated [Archaeoglobales archaeon]|nr:MAG: oligosaccharyl transferase, archaeosortase A system-associated [Archaeoglobales archaeon]